MERLRCFVIGHDSLLIECSERLLARGHELLGVITSSDRIAAWAAQRKLPVIPADKGLAQRLSETSFDYLFAITHLSILPADVLQQPRRMTINFHDGPLPQYAGLNAPAWALLEGQTEYGITWHEVVPGVDEGAVLKQRRFPIAKGETSISINTRCFEAGIESFAELLDDLAHNRVTRTPQDLSRRTYYGRHQRPNAACVLDVQQSADELEALVRALDFGPYDNPLGCAKLVHRGQAVIVTRAEARDDARCGAPGTILAVHDQEVLISTGRRVLAVLGVAAMDGTPLSISEWLSRWSLSDGDLLHGFSAAVADQLHEWNLQCAKSEAYWVRRLRELVPLQVPYCQSSPAVANRWERCRLELPSDTQATDASAQATYLASSVVYLSQLTGQSTFDVSLGDSERVPPEAFRQLTAPSAPWRVDVSPEQPWDSFVQRVASDTQRLLERSTWLIDLPARFPQLREIESLRGGQLLPVALQVNASRDWTPRPGTQLAIVFSGLGGAELWYDPRAINPWGVEQVKRQLERVWRQAVAEPTRRCGDFSLLSADERLAILENLNPADPPSPAACIHELFAAQVARTPQAIALTLDGQSWTYAELDRRAAELATHLRNLGVGPDVTVGVHLHRSLALVATVLGVLKAGGAYVPLDPAFPVDRLNFMADDAQLRVLVTETALQHRLDARGAATLLIDRLPEATAAPLPAASSAPHHLAYMIYTSGSTGKPKGVMVEHGNVSAFFGGMDQRIKHDPPGTWLAVTTLSFDISVLELLWTLCRGFQVVLYVDRHRESSPTPSAKQASPPATSGRPIDFSLYYWGNDDATTSNKYELLMAGAQFADEHGFTAVWTPERHFHAFGGPYPNPAVTGAAVAAVTKRIQVRAGSCVLPLHHPLRVAEEWSVVDNLSNGRVGVAFASGWQPHDFVLRPEVYGRHKQEMFDQMRVVQQLWRGEAVSFAAPDGQLVPRVTQPRPIQPELPIWVTTAGNPETYRDAGRCGAHLLTHLLGQTVEEVAEKIRIYRAAREQAGFDPHSGKVTLMLHTLVGASDQEVHDLVRGPMKDYLGSSVNLVKQFSWAFPAFKRPRGEGEPVDVDLDGLSAEELDAILEFAFLRYFETSGLFGSVETCLRMVDRLKAIGVDEIACLIDYGVPAATVIKHFDYLDQLRQAATTTSIASPTTSSSMTTAPATAITAPRSDSACALACSAIKSSSEPASIGALIERHNVTHLQCTPSLARMLLADDATRQALGRLQYLMVGGEALSPALAHQLRQTVRGRVMNMYGPTEATVWVSTYTVATDEPIVPIGTPIRGARMYILNGQQQPLPVGVPGELFLGGQLVVRGYHARPDLTAARFLPDPFVGGEARMYRTGDLARWRQDGTVEFLGRNDDQVKVRGYRIELGEIEARLVQHPQVEQAVAVVREDVPGDQRLVAYAVARGAEPSSESLKDQLRQALPDYMVPAHFIFLDRLPLTPNGKIDRKKLPALDAAPLRSATPYVPPDNELQVKIAQLWCDSLGLDKVGIDDNFFDVGGHSLLVVRVHRELTQAIDQPVSLTDMYRFPTIRSLVHHLSAEPDVDALQHSDDRANQRREAMTRRRHRGR